jgi:5-methylcytosine-specific restriction endonuclease McrA
MQTLTYHPVNDLFPDSEIHIDTAWVRSPAFLKSFDWAILRYKALKESAGRCVVCGRRPVGGNYLNVDHIDPRSTHPEKALCLDNLQVMCALCNKGKLNWDNTDWREAA